MVKRLIQLEVVMLLLLTLFAGCSTPTSAPPTVQPAVPTNTPVPPTETPEPPTPTPEPTATPIPPTPTKVPSFSGKVDVGGYQLSIRCIGEGEPTVVFDSGGGWDKSEWNFAFAENPTDIGIRLCSYDRAGMGRSNVSPDKPRTNMHMAVDLHNLLINANIEKPYVLVGHSLGGFTMRVFAHQYPDEVVGMVLVDSACVGEIERVLALLPPESADELNGITTLRNWYITILEEPLKAGEFCD